MVAAPHVRPAFIALLAVAAAVVVWNVVWQGGPVNRQAIAGKRVYAERCWACHELEGATGPRLTTTRIGAYGTARALFDYTRMSMPYDAPGTLTDQEYWDVTAYLALTTGGAEPDGPLGPETADSVRLRAPAQG